MFTAGLAVNGSHDVAKLNDANGSDLAELIFRLLIGVRSLLLFTGT